MIPFVILIWYYIVYACINLSFDYATRTNLDILSIYPLKSCCEMRMRDNQLFEVATRSLDMQNLPPPQVKIRWGEIFCNGVEWNIIIIRFLQHSKVLSQNHFVHPSTPCYVTF